MGEGMKPAAVPHYISFGLDALAHRVNLPLSAPASKRLHHPLGGATFAQAFCGADGWATKALDKAQLCRKCFPDYKLKRVEDLPK